MASEFGPGLGLDALPDPGQPYGLNSAQVWIFLKGLGELDLDRAVSVWDGYEIAQINGYAAALGAAEHVAEKHRPEAWSRARHAAAAIARSRLSDLTLSGEIVAVLADVAGSLVVRDMLPGRDFKLLQLPWTWHGEREPVPAPAPWETAVGAGTAVEPSAVAAAVMVDPVAAAVAAGPRVPASAPLSRPGGRPGPKPLVGGLLSNRTVRFGARALTVVATVTVLASLTRLVPNSANVESTDSPGASAVAFVPGPSLATPTGAEISSSAPPPGGVPSAPGSSAAAPPPATQPPGPTPAPKPTPPPGPTPAPTPKPLCTVISLLDLNTVKAQEKWSAAGFTGTVAFSPAIPPQYRIQWQSLAAGQSVTCSHGITVSDHAP